jgi:predicted glycosyltransferase
MTRLALYSHDAQGLGHVRRNLRIAASVVASGGGSALLVTGAREAGSLPIARHVECVTLPALHKSGDGRYRSRSLDLPLAEVLQLRSDVLCAVLESFQPDVLIVDKHPLGFCGELRAGLDRLAAHGRTALVLGLRDVLDEPATVRAELRRDRLESVIAGRYDAVWVYGDRRVYDVAAEYGLRGDVARKLRYTGYLTPDAPAAGDPPDPMAALGLGGDRLAVCMLGGGQDGAELGLAFARASRPDGMAAAIVAGPYMPAAARRRLHAVARRRGQLRVLDFVREPRALLERADRVVAMGGYNTVCELLAAHRPALIVPRESPRREQVVRAERLAALGAFDVLRRRALSPARLTAWLAKEPRRRPPASELMDVGGLQRLPALLADALASPGEVAHLAV